jgi:Ribonuclease G/E
MRRLLVAAERPPVRAALIDAEGRLEGFWKFGAGHDSLIGDRFLGRIRSIDASLDAAYVDIGLERPGFLPFDRCPHPPVEGQAILVGVTRDPLPGKGARLTARLEDGLAPPAGARPPLRLPGERPLHRLVRRVGHDIAVLVDARRPAEELDALAATGGASRVEHRPQRDWPVSMAEIEAEAAAATEPRVDLPSGGWLLFEPCRALTVIDVNSGATQAAGGERTWLKTNLEAAREIARQLRLRNIGGIVVVDFIDLKSPERRRQVADALRAAVRNDWEPCWVGAMSRLGLVEMSRRRAGPMLAETLKPSGDEE